MLAAVEAKLVIARNFAWCSEYDERSFSGRLHEENIWDWDECWLLEKALYDLAASGDFQRDVAWPVFRIFSYGLLLLGCHFDPNDTFQVRDFSGEEVHDLRERFQLVFEGFFAGEMPDQSIFERSNPLLVSASG